MKRVLRVGATVAALSIAGNVIPATPAKAYQVDCAILLCLAGGWPASAPCAHARAEFIRRITPWPIEPPLQIWRCPMRVAADGNAWNPARAWLYDAAFNAATVEDDDRWGPLLHFAQTTGRADVDISSAAFDFVRSIRVFHIEYSQYEGRNDCVMSDVTRYGSYGEQGEYAWQRSSARQVPAASNLDVPPACNSYAYRAVFADWRDHAGNYGFEEVQY